MSNRLTIHEKELIASLRIGRTREEIFNNLAASIRESHKGEMTEQEAKHAARNFIGFCQKIIDIQIRREGEQEANREEQN